MVAIFESLVLYGMMLVTGNNFAVKHESFLFQFIGLIFIKILEMATLLTLTQYLQIFFKQGTFNSKNLLYLAVLPLSSLLILYLLGINLNRQVYLYENILSIIGILGLVLGNIFIFIFLNKAQQYEQQKRREILLEQQIELQVNYYKLMNRNNTEIRKMRHDLDTTMTVLSSYANAEDLYSVQKYLKGLQKNMDLLHQVLYTGNLAINSVVTDKKARANAMGIPMDIQLAIPDELGIDDMDLCIALGNILDNALEAYEREKPKEPYISLNISFVTNHLEIIAENSCVAKVNAQSFITQKKDRENHGFGLSSIYRISKKYSGFVDIECTEGYFRITLIIFDPSR
ncbi:GHKL domain-containing protein [Eubacterium aggregans]|uniref:sensor histidine kinase n=1 Tax=Eubacterium aggregans TaxID=81409 RepID=UPI003F2EA369